MFFPYKIDSVFKHWPVANFVILALTLVMFFVSGTWSEDTIEAWILGGGSWFGLVGHLFLHAGFFHLAGNLLVLWVFGNAVCGMMSNWLYALAYLIFGLLAAAAHLAFKGGPALGASGAINGIVGMALAMYPTNQVSVFWFFFRAGTFEIPMWVLAIVWFALDAYGAWRGTGDVAYWAHLGGAAAGVIAGLVGLKLGWITLTELDHPSLANLLARKTKPSVSKRGRDKWTWEDPINLND